MKELGKMKQQKYISPCYYSAIALDDKYGYHFTIASGSNKELILKSAENCLDRMHQRVIVIRTMTEVIATFEDRKK